MSFDEYKKKKEYKAYVNDLEGGEVEESDKHWSQLSSQGQNKRPRISKNDNPKNTVSHKN